MIISFWKMHGAGNDFILLHDPHNKFSVPEPQLIRRLCARHTGIGSEGLIILQPSAVAAARMLFFNPDGSRGEMCGNGARCAARLAQRLGLASQQLTLETDAGLVRAELEGESVRIHLPPPRGWRMSLRIEAANQSILAHAVNSGVPHVAVETDDLNQVDLQNLGPLIRHHAAFAPQGTNVNFIEYVAPHEIAIRTYERGVEAETPACGTGCVACALLAGRLQKVRPPVRVRCAHGDVLTVDYQLTADGARNVSLLGPAVFVFEGQINL